MPSVMSSSLQERGATIHRRTIQRMHGEGCRMAGANASDLEWRGFAQFTAALLYELLRFRQAIFVVEQASPYADLDGIDYDARHLLARHRHTLVGCLRLYRRDGRVHIGRLAVAPAWRGRSLGRRMMGEALAACGGDFPGEPVALSAQAYLR